MATPTSASTRSSSMSFLFPDKKPDITLYFLQCSRAIRIAWLLEALALPYTLKFYERKPNHAVPDNFVEESESAMGKSPVLKDGDLVIEESGAITEYLIATYDKLGQLCPDEPAQRNKMLTYIHAAEGTYFLHGLVPFYVQRADKAFAQENHNALTADVANDLDQLDAELKASGTRYLVDDMVTAADTMMGFTIQFLLKFKLVPKDRSWEHINAWLGRIEGNVVYQRAVVKTGHKLEL